MSVELLTRMADVQSPFQRVELLRLHGLGRTLLLDGHVQLAEMDEHAYHELLVWWPLLQMQSPRRALIVGGGDGCVARELLRHESIEAVDMVEIDQVVIDVCKKEWPELSSSAYDDPRLNLFVADAFLFVKGERDPYDLIVLDSTDVYEEEDSSLSESLFTTEFYVDCKRLLAPGGFVVTQADNPVFCPYSLDGALAAFAQVFPKVGAYWGLVPSFGGYSAFCWASHEAEPAQAWRREWSERTLRYLTPGAYALSLEPMPFQTLDQFGTDRAAGL